jgi:hypothetical protein
VGELTPLTRGPLTPCERAVLDAIGLAQQTHMAVADVAGVSQRQLEDALAQLTRRGLIPRSQPARRRSGTIRALRRRSTPPPKPVPPAA